VRLTCADRVVDLSRPVVMGVLNVTDNSFSDGGRYRSLDAALAHGLAMAQAGAKIIDVGGESTRPGAQAVPLQEELDRVLPVIEGLSAQVDAVISIDTMKPEVMRAAIAAGAGMVNDVMALQAPGALATAAESSAAVCLMHMQGTPRTMQESPRYDDVVAEVGGFLQQRAQACREAGIAAGRIVLDPGFGFGKTMEHNLKLLGDLPRLTAGPYPVLIGMSRKSMLGKLTGRPVDERLAGGLALHSIGALYGARIIRTHDVRETCDAVAVAWAVREAQSAGRP
jgi:dihydropteroate synthase